MKNVIFLHIAKMGEYQEVFDEIINKIIESKLNQNVEKIFLSVVGNGFDLILPKINNIIIYQSDNIKLGELHTLNKLIDFCKFNENYNVLYLHSKGVSKGNECINDWREYMIYFNIEKWEECIKILKEYDACGVDLRSKPALHYSGNFWWATSNHINTLSKISDVHIPIPPLNDGHKVEFWITSQNKKHFSIWDCGIDVYERHLYRYEKNKYNNG